MSTDPYSQLASHIIEVKALYCEDGCGMVETSSHGDDGSAADELAASGWKVVEHSMGCLTAVYVGRALEAETGMQPIDFQVQQRTAANAEHKGVRSALGVLTRIRRDERASRAEVPDAEA